MLHPDFAASKINHFSAEVFKSPNRERTPGSELVLVPAIPCLGIDDLVAIVRYGGILSGALLDGGTFLAHYSSACASTLSEPEDLSLFDFRTVQYRRKGMVIATEKDIERIRQVPKRDLMRRGINQHTLEKIGQKQPVRRIKLTACLRALDLVKS